MMVKPLMRLSVFVVDDGQHLMILYVLTIAGRARFYVVCYRIMYIRSHIFMQDYIGLHSITEDYGGLQRLTQDYIG